jgi:carbohydrate kinase (thermoresistant glucokinase family)
LHATAPPILIVMGVSGSGKSTIAVAVAQALGWPFLEGDDLHPPANIAKMQSGQPLDDADRMPWLARIGDWIDARAQSGGAVITCSALKRSYRDLLAADRPQVLFVYLKLTQEVATRRAQSRQGHFMPASLVQSQFDTLEEPGRDEPVLVVNADRSPAAIVADIVARVAPDPSPS